MRHAMKFMVLMAIGAVVCATAPEAGAAGFGSIRGIVKDGSGNPLIGAAVFVVAPDEDAKFVKVVKRASTDNEGKFTATGILPGRYLVKAEANGFQPLEFSADVKANKATIFDSILLRRVGTLAETTSLNLDPKAAARRARGTIFHHTEEEKEQAETEERQALLLAERKPELHGYVQGFAQSASVEGGDSGSYVGTNFAVSQQLTRDVNMTVSGQLGYGDGAPQRVEVATTAHAGDRHKVSVALGYGRFTFSRRSPVPQLGQFSLSATDTWQVAGPVLIVYGMEFARFSEGANGTSVLPRFGIAVDTGARTRLFAGLAPGATADQQGSVNLESGEIVFTEPQPVAVSPAGAPIVDSSYRLQVGGEHLLSDDSSVEVMAFFDTVSGHGVGLLAIPAGANMNDATMRAYEQKGRSRGMRVVYRRRVNSVLEGSVGYAFGEGQRLSEAGLSDPASLFANDLFHVFSARVDANFVETGTRVSTVLRLAPERAVFAIDPFQGEFASYDPNLSLSLAQDLPRLSFIPGQLQLLVDLRNMLDQQASVGDDLQELVASRYHRLVRVGLSLRF